MSLLDNENILIKNTEIPILIEQVNRLIKALDVVMPGALICKNTGEILCNNGYDIGCDPSIPEYHKFYIDNINQMNFKHNYEAIEIKKIKTTGINISQMPNISDYRFIKCKCTYEFSYADIVIVDSIPYIKAIDDDNMLFLDNLYRDDLIKDIRFLNYPKVVAFGITDIERDDCELIFSCIDNVLPNIIKMEQHGDLTSTERIYYK